MHRQTLCTLIAAFAMAAAAPAAQSQVVAPIKPGLWQTHGPVTQSQMIDPAMPA